MLKIKFRSNQGSFVEGFLDASLLFVIGPLAILGSISDGMGTGIDQLTLKSTLDGFAAMAFASTLGWGVAASAIPVALYQGAWTLVGVFLGYCWRTDVIRYRVTSAENQKHRDRKSFTCALFRSLNCAVVP